MARGCLWLPALLSQLTMTKSKGQRLGLMAQAEQIASEFSLSSDHVRRVTKHLVRQLSKETLAGLCIGKRYADYLVF